MRTFRPLLLTALLGLGPAPAFADLTFPRPTDGKVTEYGDSNIDLRFTVNVTDANGKVINSAGFPQTKDSNYHDSVSFYIPTLTQLAGTGTGDNNPPVLVPVADVRQTSQRLGSLDEVADLSIESVLKDPTTGQFALANVFGTLAERLGLNTVVSVPDLFADTNGDGKLGPGDDLYSLVDMNTYLNKIPTFTLGEDFSIVDGTSADLPGMTFSTTPFSFDPSTGFTGTPYTGTGTANAGHDVSAIPEPSPLATGSLAAAALTAAARLGRRRPSPVAGRTPVPRRDRAAGGRA